MTVRLLAIDAPETSDCYSGEATARIQQLLPLGSEVRIERDKDLKDRYDRYLLYVWNEQGEFVPEASGGRSFLPLYTLGFGTAFVLGWAAHRLRSRGLAMGAFVALIMTVVALPLSDSPDGSGGARSSAGLSSR